MFEKLEVPEQAYSYQSRVAILHYDHKSYGAKIIDEFFDFDKQFILKEMKLTIPRSHVGLIGEDYFTKFLASAFKLMSKRDCVHPLNVLNPLRKKLRRIKLRLARINPNNAALGWYISNLESMIKEMWRAARIHCLSRMCEQRLKRKDLDILNAGLIF